MTEEAAPDAAPATNGEAEQAAAGAMAEFHVDLGPGRKAIVLLPVGLTAVECLRLIRVIPDLGSQAAALGPRGPRPALSRLVGLDGRPMS